MGNRSFLYTTDCLPDPLDPDAQAPEIVASVGEVNNSLPPLWRVLLSAAVPGPAQDEQQVFLPSVCGGLYSPRALAEERMFRLLDFVSSDPGLADPDDFREQIASLRTWLTTVEGEAYCADLNEWYALDGDGSLSPDAWLDAFADDCARRWQAAELAMEEDNHHAVAQLYEFEAEDAPGTLGFACWLDYDASDDADEPESVQLGAGLERFTEGGKVGIIDRHAGKVLVPPILDEVFGFEEGAAVAKLDGRYGYLDMEGRWLVAPGYDNAFDFYAGMAMVERDGLVGYVNAAGEEAVAPRFLSGSDAFVREGFAPVQLDGGFGVIDREGKLAAPARYREIEWDDGLGAWHATLDGERVVLRPDGRHWFVDDFDNVSWLSPGGDAIVERGGKLGTWRHEGGPGLPVEFDDIEEFEAFDTADRGRLYVVTLGSGAGARKGVYRADGEPVLPIDFSRVGSVPVLHGIDGKATETAGDYFLVKRQGSGAHGVWSRAANAIVLPFGYRIVRGVATAGGVFLAALRKEGGWVVTDAQGQAINEHRYEWLANPGCHNGDGWMLVQALSDIVQAWSAGRPVPAGRDGRTRYLGSDGLEDGEVEYLLRAVRAAPPIAAPRGRLRRLFARDKDHVIEGVGDVECCVRLGDIYAFGEGVPVDLGQALRWYATAASGGHDGARYQYGYYLAMGMGCEADPAAAREQFAALEASNPQASVMLGYLYEQGLGGAADPERARACYERAARDDKYGHAEAQLRAGNCWWFGVGGPVDKSRALFFIELAAERTAYRREPYPEAIRAAAGLNAELALAAHEAGDTKLHARHRQRVLRYYKELVEEGEHDGLLGLARCHLGEYGGKTEPAKARAILDQAEGTEAEDEARGLRREHGLG